MQAELRDKRRARRLGRIDEGVELLARWLEDLVRQGLGRLGERGLDLDTMARRLNDCQAQGLARRVQALDRLRPERTGAVAPLLLGLGQLALICEAWPRRDELGPLGATIERVVGLTLTEAEAIATGERVEDTWLVLGQRVELDDETRFTTTRTWLVGQRSARLAMHLAYAWGDQGFLDAKFRDQLGREARLRALAATPEQPEPLPPALVPGKAITGTLAFFPGALPLRAAFAEVHHSAFLPRRRLRLGPRAGLEDALDAFADALAVDPFADHLPVVLGDVRLALSAPDAQAPHHAAIVDGPLALPLTPLGPSDLLALTAITGGAPFDLVGEWDGHTLTPLAAVTDAGLTPVTRPTAAPDDARRLTPDPELLALERRAILGTATGPADPRPESQVAPPLGPLAPALAARAPEPALLLRAAFHGLARRAGARPVPAPTPLDEAPPEPRPEAPGRLAAVLARALAEPALHADVTAALDARGLRLPCELVPLVFERAPRRAPHPAFGARLPWLNGLFGAPPEPDRPLEALLERVAGRDPSGHPVSFEGRIDALIAARPLAPEAAREALEPTLSGERPERRAQLVSALTVGLAPSDLPLLERLSKDRAKAVRLAVVELLQRLPESALAQRVAARATQTLRLVDERLALTYPQPDPGWEADGLGDGPIGALPPGESRLVHLIERVPPPLWERHLARTPLEISRLLWNVEPPAAREPLYAALAAATVRFYTPSWIEPLWVAFAALGGRPPLALYELAAPSERRRLFELRLAQTGALRDGDERLFETLPPPFGPTLSAAVLSAFDRLGPGRYGGAHPLVGVLRSLALGLDPPALQALFTRPELNRPRALRELVQTRLRLHQELADA